MYKKPTNRNIATIAIAALVFLFAPQPAQASDLWTGNGGSGIRLAVLEPEGKGLSKDEQWMLSLIQSSITGDFNKFSAMTIIDRQNLERIFAEWEESMSGAYSDEGRIRIGQLANASHILTGTITKTPNAFMLELSVTDVASGQRKASYSPRPVAARAIENLSAVKEATADLLGQLGVNLTARGREDLKGITALRIQAEAALARGVVAQRQGTEVAALSYYFQAATLDASLLEAVNRSSVMATNISSGNIGDDTRNDIIWRRQWVARLTEAEQYFNDLFRTNILPYTLFYSTEIIPGDVNYQTETQTLSINTNLRATGAWAWLSSVERALQAVWDGLEATKRKEVWGLQSWPWQGVTNLRPFEQKTNNFTITAELVNSRNAVIGRVDFQARGTWRFVNDGRNRPQIQISDDDRKQISFRNVKADDITDRITIRIATVNNMDASIAAQTGVLQIKAISKADWDSNILYTMRRNVIIGYRGNDIFHTTIPSNIWNEPDISIGEGAFQHKRLMSLAIPNNVIAIGNNAFANNQLTNITIPNSVTSIGNSAFANNQLTRVTIGDNVRTIGENAFSNNQFTQIIIPRSVVEIGANAFNINSLTKIIIPANVKIARNSFTNDFMEKYKIEGEGVYRCLERVIWHYFVGGSYDEAVRTHGTRLITVEEEARQVEAERIRQAKQAEEDDARRIKNAEERVKQDEEEKFWQIKEAERIKALRAAWRYGIEFPIFCGNVKFAMREINPYYTTGYNFNVVIPTSVEFYKGNLKFFRFGVDLDLLGGIELDRKQIRNDMSGIYTRISDIQTGPLTGTGKVGAFVRLYPIDVFYLSGGYGLGWYRDWEGESDTGEKIRGEQGTIVAPVTSLGIGLSTNWNKYDDGTLELFLNLHYNIVHISEVRTAGYWTIGFGIKGDARFGARD